MDFTILEDSLKFLDGRKTDFSDVGSMAIAVANLLIILAFGVSFVMLAYALIQFSTSTGDPKRMEKPQNALVWSVIGMVVSLALFGIKNLILRLLGLDSGIFY